MEFVGKILHTASSGRLIIKASSKLISGNVLLDSKGRKIAKVLEIIGPVSSPYVSASSVVDKSELSPGTKVYLGRGPSRVGR